MRDHLLKIQRAKEHLDWIGTYLKPWIEGKKHSQWLEPDDLLPGNTRLMTKLTEEPAEYPLTVKIGEFLHNMRSSLDLLAYELAVAYTNPLPDDIAESSEFPIFGDEDRQGNVGTGNAAFHLKTRKGVPVPGSGLHKIRGMDARAQTEIERLQPYKRGSLFREDPLWKLHELDRINKHRLLHVVAISGTLALRMGAGYDPARDYPFTTGDIHSNSGIALSDQSTTIGSFPLRPDIRIKKMKVHPYAAVEVVIDNVPSLTEAPDLFKGPPVVGTLAEIHSHVVRMVIPTLTRYL